MTKTQSLILNTISVALAVLVLGNVFVANRNQKLNQQLAEQQIEINNAQQAKAIFDRLTARIAQGSETDTKLHDLMVKFGLKITLAGADGKRKDYPTP